MEEMVQLVEERKPSQRTTIVSRKDRGWVGIPLYYCRRVRNLEGCRTILR